MNPDALRRRLAGFSGRAARHRRPAGLHGSPGPLVAVAAPAASQDAIDLADQPLIPSAVLVPIILGMTPGVLLTKRTAHLNTHPGQVAFPGGRIDPSDLTAEDAALREAEEEIALDPSAVELVGRLPDYITGTGYRITPVLGLIPPGLELMPSPDEVEAILELPVAVLLDPEAPQRQRMYFRGRWREYWVWPHPNHYIWGATAGILVQLADLLREPD